jgi:hypothetical protein
MRRSLPLLAFALILSGASSGKTSSSTQNVDKKAILKGTVYDRNGSVIALSHVVARTSRGKEYQTTTNTEGIYKLELPVDVYKIEVNAPGFCPTTVEMFQLRNSPSVAIPLDVVLDVSEGDEPCKQKTMIRKEPKVRKPEIFRSIAE